MNFSIQLRKNILLGLFYASFLPLIAYVNTVPAEFLEEPQDFTFLFALILGYIGALLIWWQFWLGFRGIVAKLIVDHIWVNNLHKKIGIYGTLLIFGHPFFILLSAVIRSGIQALEYYLPNIDTEYQRHILFGNIAFDILFVIWIASAILRSKIAFRPWRYLHYFTLILFPLVYIHAHEIGSGILSNSILGSYFDLLFALYMFGFVIRILYQTGFNKYEYILKSKTNLTETVTEYTFVPNNGKPVGSNPGQYFYIQPGFISEDHPFSVCKYNEFDGSISFGIKTFGRFTKKLKDVQKGDIVFLDGPYGVFTNEIKDSDRPSVFIAGGIGITPFVQYAVNKELKKPEILFYGNRTTAEIAYKDQLEMGLKKVVHVLSNEETAEYEKGYITKELVEKHLKNNIKSYDFYVCGPPIMMKLVEKFLKEAGVPHVQIMMEKFSL